MMSHLEKAKGYQSRNKTKMLQGDNVKSMKEEEERLRGCIQSSNES